MHYYSKNIADYRKDTGHLSLLEHGIYNQLLDTYYLCEKPIETQRVMRRLSIITQEEVSAFNTVLSDFFTVSECGNYHYHSRCDAEIAKYKAKADTSRVNGSKGGRPRKPRKTQPVILANPDVTQTKGNHKPITNNQVKEINKEKPSRFTPPSLSDVRVYVDSKGFSIDPEAFIDFYESKGWMIGKNKMKSWEACVRTWAKKNPPATVTSIGGWE